MTRRFHVGLDATAYPSAVYDTYPGSPWVVPRIRRRAHLAVHSTAAGLPTIRGLLSVWG